MNPTRVPEVPDEGAVWSAQDTTPSAIEEALRDLLIKQYARNGDTRPHVCSTWSWSWIASGAARS